MHSVAVLLAIILWFDCKKIFFVSIWFYEKKARLVTFVHWLCGYALCYIRLSFWLRFQWMDRTSVPRLIVWDLLALGLQGTYYALIFVTICHNFLRSRWNIFDVLWPKHHRKAVQRRPSVILPLRPLSRLIYLVIFAQRTVLHRDSLRYFLKVASVFASFLVEKKEWMIVYCICI